MPSARSVRHSIFSRLVPRRITAEKVEAAVPNFLDFSSDMTAATRSQVANVTFASVYGNRMPSILRNTTVQTISDEISDYVRSSDELVETFQAQMRALSAHQVAIMDRVALATPVLERMPDSEILSRIAAHSYPAAGSAVTMAHHPVSFDV